MEEISLKDLLKTLLKGKYIIIGVTVASLVIGAAAYLLTPKKYKATASILANPISNVAGMESEQLAFPNMDIEVYREQFLNHYTVRKTIEELDLRDRNGDLLSYEAFSSMVAVKNPDKTNILDVSVSGKKTEETMLIANALSRHFIDYITDVYQSSAVSAAKAISERLKEEEANLDAASVRLRDYLISSENIDIMNAEISNLTNQITSYKASLNDLIREIEADLISVEQLRNLAGAASLDGVTAIVSGGAYTGSYQLQLSEANELGQALYTMKLADVESRLIENINNKNAIEKMTAELEDRLQSLKGRQAEEQYKYNDIIRQYNMAESVYSAYVSQYNQALIIEASNFGNVNIKIISEAIEPVKAYNKSVMIYGGAAGVIGVLSGTFFVLFRHYWNEEYATVEADAVSVYQEV